MFMFIKYAWTNLYLFATKCEFNNIAPKRLAILKWIDVIFALNLKLLYAHHTHKHIIQNNLFKCLLQSIWVRRNSVSIKNSPPSKYTDHLSCSAGTLGREWSTAPAAKLSVSCRCCRRMFILLTLSGVTAPTDRRTLCK